MSTLMRRVEARLSRWRSIDRTDLRLYALTCLIAVGLKLAWRNCRPTEPGVFLVPLVAMLRLILGTPFTFRPDGYWNQAWEVLIAKGCAGMNYFLIVLGLLVFSHLRFLRGQAKYWAFAAFLAGSYHLTIVANVSRIVCAILLGRTGLVPSVLTGEPHLALGTVIYFFFLIAGNMLAGVLIRGWTKRTEGCN